MALCHYSRWPVARQQDIQIRDASSDSGLGTRDMAGTSDESANDVRKSTVGAFLNSPSCSRLRVKMLFLRVDSPPIDWRKEASRRSYR
jgi:hypothetical protein